ncbi:AMP-binding protein [Streptomyces sp. NPDC001480]|uniref:AMP-binding protein n=1 Tax=Streptomyces sp. NPDC001480 TaxID=3364577 RepID=UPI0036B6C8AA
MPATDTALDSLRVCLLSGDWIPLSLPERIRERTRDCRIVSLGGATEGSIWSILHEIDRVAPDWTSIPYGRAMNGQSVQILDHALTPCPTWTPGQIHIGGHGTALGYWRFPEGERESFVFDGRTGRRLYRTGDWGRLRPDGTIEFLGRRDAQVKVRGHRIELREVESALAGLAGVEQAAVVATEDRNDRRLAAFVVSESPTPEIREDLARRLPDYMLPATLTALAALPMSSTDKLDRAALVHTAEALAAPRPPAQTSPAPQHSPASDTPHWNTVTEQLVRETLNDLLPGHPGLDDDLLAFGLTSVDFIRLANAMEKHGRRPDLKTFYRNPVLRTLLEHTGPPDSPGDAPTAATPWTSFRELTDPADRANFRAAAPFYPPAPPTRTLPALSPPATTRAATPRSFTPAPVSAQALSRLLSCMRRTDRDGRSVFAYPSAGGLYNVRAHVHLRPGRIDGTPGGTYTYHPDAHDLIPQVQDIDLDTNLHIGPVNRPLAASAAFTLFLTTDPADSAPLYGRDAEPLALLNAGYMGQLLCRTAADLGLGLCPVHGVDFETVRWLLPDGERLVLLHTLVGGVPAPHGEAGR